MIFLDEQWGKGNWSGWMDDDCVLCGVVNACCWFDWEEILAELMERGESIQIC